MASMDILPNDPRFLALNSEELLFTYHYKKRYLEEIRETVRNELGAMLGTRWYPEAVHARASNKKPAPRTHYDFPLAVLLNSSLSKSLKTMIPKPVNQKLTNGEVEFEDIYGVNLIREHQRKLMAQASKLLNK